MGGGQERHGPEQEGAGTGHPGYGAALQQRLRLEASSSHRAGVRGKARGTNLYRNKDAYYFLPSENEWYKAAHDNAAGSAYFPYPTGSSTAPIAVASGTQPDSAVYFQTNQISPAEVTTAGGLRPYGTMGQGGNIWE